VNDHDFVLHPAPRRLLEGRRALVTGATAGIGRGTAFELAAHGAAVAIDHRGKEDEAGAMAAAIESAGGRAIAVRMDITKEDEVQAGFARAREAFGGLDLLVNNAGVEAPYALVDMPLEEWNRVVEVNLTGVFLGELAPKGIRVVSVAPGAIETPINRDVLADPEQKQAVLDEIPLGRWGQVPDVAQAIAWVASEQASYVTGTTLFVDGGMTPYPKFV
jgi:glucose 1-dehydrogenase